MSYIINAKTIQSSIDEAANILPTVWPLYSFIAMNPLWDLRKDSFSEAIQFMRQYLPIRGSLSHREYSALYRDGAISNSALRAAWLEKGVHLNDITLDQMIGQFDSQNNIESNPSSDLNHIEFPIEIRDEIILFLSRHFQMGSNPGVTPSSLWEHWRQFKSGSSPQYKSYLNKLPNNPLLALQVVISKLTRGESTSLRKIFEMIFSHLLGWHGYIKWIESKKGSKLVTTDCSLAEIALIWCCYAHIEEIEFTKTQSRPSNSIKEQRDEPITDTWQRALELTYQESLLASLNQNKPVRNQPSAQFIFCMDVRSEAIRRHLESLGNYETFGYAGFFGTTFLLEEATCHRFKSHAPALLEPTRIVRETTPKTYYSKLKSLLNEMRCAAKRNAFSTFAFFEMIGSLMIFPLLQQAFKPSLNLPKAISRSFDTHSFFDSACIEETANNMAVFLKTIGLTDYFAPIIVICGHQAKTTNNPYHASFECGACGGHSGYVNSKITCEILNSPIIRSLLAKQGIVIPDSSTFMTGVHETTTNKLFLEDTNCNNHPLLHQISIDIEKALSNITSEKTKNLPAFQDSENRANHFAELIPEWGLINNAALIIGQRHLTEHVDLSNRVFLHSYKWALDTEGTLLESILKGPMIVAHWINAQYYFSATDPDIYGAGNKAIHNIVSNIGVMEGNHSDLKIGLPLQSLFYQNERLHLPLRLLVVIEAPLHTINQILDRNPDIKSLFENNWINLHIIKPRNIKNVSG